MLLRFGFLLVGNVLACSFTVWAYPGERPPPKGPLRHSVNMERTVHNIARQKLIEPINHFLYGPPKIGKVHYWLHTNWIVFVEAA